MLTLQGRKADTWLVTAKSVAGIGVPNSQGGQTASSAVFLCLQKGKPSYGRAIRGAYGLAGILEAGTPTRMVSPSLIGVSGATRKAYSRNPL